MELTSYQVNKKGEFILMPVGDIQYTGTRHDTADIDRLKRHVEWGVKHDAWFLGMGDYIDFASPSNRQRIKAAALYDTAEDVIEETAIKMTDELYNKALKGSEGRWLGLLEGHHYTQLRDGTTSDQYLTRKLKSRFLGTCAYIRLVFPGGTTKKSNVLIWAHHGVGSGRIGAPLNKLELLPTYWDADIYLMGHQSKKVAAPLDRIYPVFNGNGRPHLNHRTLIIAGTGGFSRAYLQGHCQGNTPRGGYVEKGMLSPVALGGIVVKIRPRYKKVGDMTIWTPDVEVSL